MMTLNIFFLLSTLNEEHSWKNILEFDSVFFCPKCDLKQMLKDNYWKLFAGQA